MKHSKAMDPREADQLSRDIIRLNKQDERRKQLPERLETARNKPAKEGWPLGSAAWWQCAVNTVEDGTELPAFPDGMASFERALLTDELSYLRRFTR